MCRETSSGSVYTLYTVAARAVVQFRCKAEGYQNGGGTSRSSGTTEIQVCRARIRRLQKSYEIEQRTNKIIVYINVKICDCRINKKIPRGPPSPPAPVMHSPTRKVTVKEQKEWKIPPCISNWKNAKVPARKIFTLYLTSRVSRYHKRDNTEM